jgi:hypothetical protein
MSAYIIIKLDRNIKYLGFLKVDEVLNVDFNKGIMI